MNIQTIQAAMAGTSEKERKEAERVLQQYILTQPTAFILQSSELLGNEGVPLNTRQFMGTLLRRAILLKSPDGSCTLWSLLPADDRSRIKNQLSGLLINPNRTVMRRAADIISAICSIELPKGEWPGIINILTTNTKNENQSYCLAAIITLGFLCTLLREDANNAALSPAELEGILTGILLGMQSPVQEIRETSIGALGDMMELIKPFMVKPEVRNLAFTQLMSVFEKHQEESTRAAALKALIEFTRVNYQWLHDYLIPIFKVTLPFMSHPQSDDLCKLAMEVWDTVATEFSNLRQEDPSAKNYLEGSAVKDIVATLLVNMCFVEGGQQDPDNDIRGQAYLTLYDIGSISGNSIYDQIIEFVGSNLHNQNYKARSASLRAFCTLLEGVDSNKMELAINSALSEFLNMLDDNSKDVQGSAAFCLSKISEQFPKCFLCHKDFDKIVEHLQLRLQRSPKISIQLCNVFIALAEDPSRLTHSKVLQTRLQSLILALIKNAARDLHSSDTSLLDKSYLAAMTLINGCATVDFCLQFIPFIVKEFPNTYTIGAEKQAIVQNGLMALLQFCLIKLKSERETSRLQPAQLEAIFTVVTGHFIRINDVTPDGLYVLGALSFFCVNKTVPYTENIWRFIETALGKYQDSILFKAALGCLYDLSESQPDGFKSKLFIVPQLIQALTKQPMKVLRLPIFSCLGDIFLAMGTACHPYLEQFMRVVVLACQATLGHPNVEAEAREQMQQVLITVMTCVIHTLSGRDGSGLKFKAFLQPIFEFVKLSLQQKGVSLDFMESALLMLIDILNFYKREVGLLASEPVLDALIAKLTSTNTGGRFTENLNYSQRILMEVRGQ